MKKHPISRSCSSLNSPSLTPHLPFVPSSLSTNSLILRSRSTSALQVWAPCFEGTSTLAWFQAPPSHGRIVCHANDVCMIQRFVDIFVLFVWDSGVTRAKVLELCIAERVRVDLIHADQNIFVPSLNPSSHSMLLTRALASDRAGPIRHCRMDVKTFVPQPSMSE